jgi:hypothetical protein
MNNFSPVLKRLHDKVFNPTLVPEALYEAK